MQAKTFLKFSINYIEDTKLANKLLPYAKKYLNDQTLLTNSWGYKNTYTDTAGLAKFKDLDFFVTYLISISKKYFEENQIKIKSKYDLDVSIFASEMVLGDQHTMHNHPGALLSGLIYLQVPIGSSNLEFDNPRNMTSWNLAIDNGDNDKINDILTTDNLQKKIIIEPKIGLLIFWESWMKHCVPFNQSLDGRITMVFNIGIKDRV